MRARGLALLLALGACDDGTATFSHEPVPLTLAGPGGGLVGFGTAASRTDPFPMLVDTGSPLTTFSDGTGVGSAQRGTLELYSAETDGTRVPRLKLADIQLFVTALGGSGLDQASPIGGVLGGDNLRRFVLGLGYLPTPQISLSDELVLDECELSERCASVLPFSLAGGRQLIDIGDDIYGYPASYVLLDGCVEPALDPLEPGLACSSLPDCGDITSCAGIATCETDIRNCQADAQRYVSHGIDVRFAVATGFPGLALTESAYDRLRGRGSAAALFAADAHSLFSPGQSAEANGVGVDTLGRAAVTLHDGDARAALALVGLNGYFGACAELARSRRLRRNPPETMPPPKEAGCLRSPSRSSGDPLVAGLLKACADATSNGGVCDDTTADAHTTAYVELQAPVQVIVVPNTTTLLQSINADVRPQSATVEGIIGTEALRRMGSTVDYFRNRFVATCADDSCRVFPRSGHGTDCQRPTADSVFGAAGGRSVAGGGCAIP